MKRFIFGGVMEGKHHKDVEGALHSSEAVICRVQQSRLWLRWFCPDNLYVTTSRILLRKSHLFGLSSTLSDVELHLLLKLEAAHGLAYSSFSAQLRYNGGHISIQKIPKKAAMEIEKSIRHPFVVGKPSRLPSKSGQETMQNSHQLKADITSFSSALEQP